METLKQETYHDNWLDQLFIWLFTRKMAQASGKTTPFKGYDGFVHLSQQMVQGRNAHQQQELIAIVLQSLVPDRILAVIRALFSPTQLVCELNAWFATQLFEWLVGPCEVRTVEIKSSESQNAASQNAESQTNRGVETVKVQRSGVYIKKCRYLEQSGCTGLCINMCKLPTQKFFAEGFGIPLTMTPNFEDLSCEMVFGQVPPPLETEVAYQQPCLSQCPTKTAAIACPKVRE